MSVELRIQRMEFKNVNLIKCFEIYRKREGYILYSK